MFTISRNQPCFQRSPHQQPSSQKLVKLKSARPRRVQIGHHRQNRQMERSCPFRTGNVYPVNPVTSIGSTSDWPGVCHSSLESKVSMRPLHESASLFATAALEPQFFLLCVPCSRVKARVWAQTTRTVHLPTGHVIRAEPVYKDPLAPQVAHTCV